MESFKRFKRDVATRWTQVPDIEEVELAGGALNQVSATAGDDLKPGNGGSILEKCVLDPQDSTLQKSLLEFGHLLTFRDVQTPLDASTWPKCACLVGSSETNSLAYSEEINLSLLVLLPGCRLPQSVETKADMVVEVLKSGEGAKIGPTEETVRDVAEGTILSYVHTAPKVIKASDRGSMILLVARTGAPSSNFSFPDLSAGVEYQSDIMKISDVNSYYENMAKSYDESMTAWGYSLPAETVKAALRRGLKETTSLVDMGCGSGLIGLELEKEGFTNLTGVDFAEAMIAKAEAQGCYKRVVKADLLKTLPFQDGEFDSLVSTAVTTYLAPYVLTEWIRVIRPGGILIFTHKSSIFEPWEQEQAKLEECGLWRKQWVSREIPYLPSLMLEGKDNCTEMAKIYMYEKL